MARLFFSGCYFQGKAYNSSTSWENPDDPCETFTCRVSRTTSTSFSDVVAQMYVAFESES